RSNGGGPADTVALVAPIVPVVDGVPEVFAWSCATDELVERPNDCEVAELHEATSTATSHHTPPAATHERNMRPVLGRYADTTAWRFNNRQAQIGAAALTRHREIVAEVGGLELL